MKTRWMELSTLARWTIGLVLASASVYLFVSLLSLAMIIEEAL